MHTMHTCTHTHTHTHRHAHTHAHAHTHTHTHTHTHAHTVLTQTHLKCHNVWRYRKVTHSFTKQIIRVLQHCVLIALDPFTNRVSYYKVFI